MLDNPKSSPFTEGQKAYYPGHGVVSVEAIEHVNTLGVSVAMYRLRMISGDIIMTPVAMTKKNGLRPLATKTQVEEAIQVLKGTPQKRNGIWQEIAKSSQRKLVTGEMEQIAEVIRDLHPAVSAKTDVPQTYRGLFQHAFDLLLPEVALILEKTETEVLEYLSKKSGKEFRPDFGSGARGIVADICATQHRKATAPQKGNGGTHPPPKPPSYPASSHPQGNERAREKEREHHRERVRALESEVRRTHESLEAAHATVNDLRGQLVAQRKSHEAEVTTLKAQLKNTEHNLAIALSGLKDAQSEIGSKAAEFESRMRALQERLEASERRTAVLEENLKNIGTEAGTRRPRKQVARTKAQGSGLRLQADGFLWNPAWDARKK